MSQHPNHQSQAPSNDTGCRQNGQAALEAVLLTLVLALAVFGLVDDSPVSRLIAALSEHQARLARGLALP